MRRFSTQQFKPDSFEGFVTEHAAGITLKLDATITSQAQGLLVLPNHGDRGFIGTDMYENVNGSIVKYALTTI